jgi:protein-disulfide isomerase
LPQIEQEYIKTGKVKYVARDFPLGFHKDASKAAEAANCAADQDKFWDMYGRIFSNQKALGLKDLQQHAQDLGLDLPKFNQCLESGKYSAKIRKDLDDAQKAGITGAPTFLLGLTVPNDPKVKILKTLVGAKSYASFKEAIDSLLSLEVKK